MDPAGATPPAPANILFSAEGPDPCPRCLNGFMEAPLCTDPPCEKWPEPAGYDVFASPENQETEDSSVPLPEYDESIEELVPGGPEDDLVVEEPPAPGNTPTSVSGEVRREIRRFLPEFTRRRMARSLTAFHLQRRSRIRMRSARVTLTSSSGEVRRERRSFLPEFTRKRMARSLTEFLRQRKSRIRMRSARVNESVESTRGGEQEAGETAESGS